MKLLRNKETGAIFGWADQLSKQSWMEPYDPATNVVIAKEEEPEVVVEIKEEPEQPRWDFRKNDGPVYRDVVRLANKKEVSLDDIDTFNPGPSDFKVKYSNMSVKSAVSEFKIRAKDGE